jgi:hypothetical protein
VKRQLVAALGVLTLGVALATTTPASAAGRHASKDIHETTTTDRSPGGRAYFNARADTVTVCDVESDGYAAVVYLGVYYEYSNPPGFPYYEGWLQDKSHDKNCKSKSFDKLLPEGQRIVLKVCLHKNTTHGTGDSYCRYSRDGWA